MFKNGQIVKTAYGEQLEVLEQLGSVVYFYYAKPVHVSKVFAV
jgi:hypothetical protein